MLCEHSSRAIYHGVRCRSLLAKMYHSIWLEILKAFLQELEVTDVTNLELNVLSWNFPPSAAVSNLFFKSQYHYCLICARNLFWQQSWCLMTEDKSFDEMTTRGFTLGFGWTRRRVWWENKQMCRPPWMQSQALSLIGPWSFQMLTQYAVQMAGADFITYHISMSWTFQEIKVW